MMANFSQLMNARWLRRLAVSGQGPHPDDPPPGPVHRYLSSSVGRADASSGAVSSLDGNLFPDHESPTSLPWSDRDSEVAVIFNDGSD
jgi:hypothetical protein